MKADLGLVTVDFPARGLVVLSIVDEELVARLGRDEGDRFAGEPFGDLVGSETGGAGFQSFLHVGVRLGARCEAQHSDPRRDASTLCVVEDVADLWALDRAAIFSGRYHVLGGLISPMDGIGPDLLQISSLVKRVADDNIDEVILALTPSVDGDTTSLYVARLLKPFTRVSRIAYGLPVGSELEYADDVTLSRALEGRRVVE